LTGKTFAPRALTGLREIAAALNEGGITAPWGGEWQATQVRRILKAADAL
jgi:hypothetical protein